MDTRIRTERLRETLYVQVSAAAVTADEGRAFKELDRRLASAAPGEPSERQAAAAPAKPTPLTEQARAQFEDAAVIDAAKQMEAFVGKGRGRARGKGQGNR